MKNVRSRLFEVKRQRRLQKRKDNRKKLLAVIVIITCGILVSSFLSNYAAEYEVLVVECASKCIFVLTPDGMTHKIYVDDGYEYNIGDKVLIAINMFADPPYREVWLLEDIKGGEF